MFACLFSGEEVKGQGPTLSTLPLVAEAEENIFIRDSETKAYAVLCLKAKRTKYEPSLK